ncbi:MAG: hypothetical protein ACO3MV_03755 [Flavobacteriales bacterium]
MNKKDLREYILQCHSKIDDLSDELNRLQTSLSDLKSSSELQIGGLNDSIQSLIASSAKASAELVELSELLEESKKRAESVVQDERRKLLDAAFQEQTVIVDSSIMQLPADEFYDWFGRVQDYYVVHEKLLIELRISEIGEDGKVTFVSVGEDWGDGEIDEYSYCESTYFEAWHTDGYPILIEQIRRSYGAGGSNYVNAYYGGDGWSPFEFDEPCSCELGNWHSQEDPREVRAEFFDGRFLSFFRFCCSDGYDCPRCCHDRELKCTYEILGREAVLIDTEFFDVSD